MAAKKPTHAQAQLQLQLYDLRREEKLRKAREWVLEKYFPETLEDVQKLAPPGSQENAYLRMVASYWEQACRMLNCGLLHEDLFFQTTNEFYFLWDRSKAGVAELRRQYKNPRMWREIETASQRYEKWVCEFAPEFLDVLRGWMQQMRDTARNA